MKILLTTMTYLQGIIRRIFMMRQMKFKNKMFYGFLIRTEHWQNRSLLKQLKVIYNKTS